MSTAQQCKGGRGKCAAQDMIRQFRAEGLDDAMIREQLGSLGYSRQRISQLLKTKAKRVRPVKEVTSRKIEWLSGAFVEGMQSADRTISRPLLFEASMDRIKDLRPKRLTQMMRGIVPDGKSPLAVRMFHKLQVDAQRECLSRCGIFTYEVADVQGQQAVHADASANDDVDSETETFESDADVQGQQVLHADAGANDDVDLETETFDSDVDEADGGESLNWRDSDNEGECVDWGGSESDCGGSDGTTDDGGEHAPLQKRQRVGSESTESAGDVADSHPSHLAATLCACIPEAVGPCRLSREISVPIYVMNWRNRKTKPCTLHPWRPESGGVVDDQLVAFAFRENGLVYYAAKSALDSPTFSWLLASKSHIDDFYARVPLLLSPCIRFLELDTPLCSRSGEPLRIRRLRTEDCLNDLKVDCVDGLAECGLSFAKEQGLVDSDVHACDDEVTVLPAWQFRAVLWTGSHTILAKGVLMVNVALGYELLIPESCIKAQSSARVPGIQYGLDVTMTSERPRSFPSLTPSLLAVLHLRIQSVAAADRRQTLAREMSAMLVEMARYTGALIPYRAWNLRRGSMAPGATRVPLRRVTSGVDTSICPLDHSRFPIHKIDLVCRSEHGATAVQGPLPSVTPTQQLLETHDDPRPRDFRRGNRDMLARGQCLALALRSRHRKRPHFNIPADTFFLLAVSDPANRLAADNCYVIYEGHAFLGPVAVWRYPCHTTHDIEILTAVEPLPGSILPENSIVLSRKGRVNSGMAGGDLDGDFNCVSFCHQLTALVAATEVSVRALNLQPFEDEVTGMLQPVLNPFSARDLSARFAEYRDHSVQLKTMNVKGLVCAMAERAAHPAIRSPDALTDGSLHASLRFACLSHKAMDVPKKYRADDVYSAGRAMLSGLQLARRKVGGKTKRPSRSTAFTARQLRVTGLPAARRCRIFDAYAPTLDSHRVGMSLGQVWLPLERIVLGREAGRLVMHHLLSLPKREKFFRRSACVTPLGQIAQFLHHKLGRKLGQDPATWLDLPVEAIEAALSSNRERPIGSLRTLYDSNLP